MMEPLEARREHAHTRTEPAVDERAANALSQYLVQAAQVHGLPEHERVTATYPHGAEKVQFATKTRRVTEELSQVEIRRWDAEGRQFVPVAGRILLTARRIDVIERVAHDTNCLPLGNRVKGVGAITHPI